MSSSRVIATRKRAVYMAHICSKCGFPMISIVQIQAEAQKTYSFSQSKASQIAGSTAENAINEEIRRIESCRQTKSVLVGKRNESSMISPGYFCESSFIGHQTHCPFCFNIEPWKVPSTSTPMSELKDEHFPVVFASAAEAEGWARDYITGMLSSLRDVANSNAVEDAKKEAVEALFKFRRLSQMIDELPERGQVQQMEAQLAELRQRKAKLGILDIKGKKVMGNHIKEMRQRLEDAQKTLTEKESPLFDEAINEKRTLMFSRAVAFGCKDGIASSNLKNAYIFYFVPNDIPESVIDEFKPFLAQTAVDSVDSAVLSVDSDSVTTEPEAEAIVCCRKCGNKLLPGSIFCSRCGGKVE